MGGLFRNEVHTFHIRGEDILYEPETGAVFKIDGAIKEILKFDEPIEEEKLIGELSHKYEVSDIQSTLQELKKLEILLPEKITSKRPIWKAPDSAPPGIPGLWRDSFIPSDPNRVHGHHS